MFLSLFFSWSSWLSLIIVTILIIRNPKCHCCCCTFKVVKWYEVLLCLLWVPTFTDKRILHLSFFFGGDDGDADDVLYVVLKLELTTSLSFQKKKKIQKKLHQILFVCLEATFISHGQFHTASDNCTSTDEQLYMLARQVVIHYTHTLVVNPLLYNHYLPVP